MTMYVPLFYERLFSLLNCPQDIRLLPKRFTATICTFIHFCCYCYSVVQSCLTICDPTDCSLQAALSMGFLRQEYWSRLPFPSLEVLPELEIEAVSPAFAERFFTTEPPGKPLQ